MSASPNLLLVVIDSARADRCSCYGYHRPTTPNLDALAEDGVRFEAAHAESSWTLPMSLTLLTGLAPREHQAEAVRALPEGIPTIPQLLRARGYATLGVSANSFFGPRCGQTGFEAVLMAPQCRFWTQCLYRYGPQWVGLVDAGGRWVSARFRKWLRQAPEPWLAMLWLDDLHHPYVGRPRFLRRVSDRRLPLWRRTQLSRRMRRMLTLSAVGTEEGFLDLAALYDASLAYADWVVGRVIDALRTHSSWARTAVVVTADHGDMLGERRLLGHGRTADMYQALLRVPLIARLPGLGAGSSSQALVQLADVTRTLAELGGVADGLAPTAAPAVDLRDAAAGRGRPFALSEREPMGERSVAQARKKSPEFDFTPHQCHMVAVVQEGWRLIHRGDGRDSLFHAAADPDERDDLLVAEPARAAQLREVVDRWKAEVIPHPAVAGLQLQDSAILDQRLQDLGYF